MWLSVRVLTALQKTSFQFLFFYFFKGLFIFIFYYLSVCFCVCSILSYAWYHRGQKRALDPLKLKLQMFVSHHVGTGNWTQVLVKSSQCFQPLSHLSNPSILFQTLIQQLTAIHNSSLGGSNVLFWFLLIIMYKVYIHICRQNTHAHTIKSRNPV